jgi:hypothetical protein
MFKGFRKEVGDLALWESACLARARPLVQSQHRWSLGLGRIVNPKEGVE